VHESSHHAHVIFQKTSFFWFSFFWVPLVIII